MTTYECRYCKKIIIKDAEKLMNNWSLKDVEIECPNCRMIILGKEILEEIA